MSTFNHKVDFAVILSVHHANPNGDPLNGNRPREDYDGLGEISDVCIKRKLRNRLMDMGQPVFVQSDDKRMDGYKTLRERAESIPEIKKNLGKGGDADAIASAACKTWIDVRSFGQVFAFKGDGVSVGVRGPVSLHPAFSIAPVDIVDIQITKSVSSVDNGGKKSSDTMGTKYRVEHGVYVFFGSINCQLAEKTGFSAEDAQLIKQALQTLFDNDASSARPEGSMVVEKLYWWEHNCKSGQYSSAKVHRSLRVTPTESTPYFSVELAPLDGLVPEEYDGV